MACSTVLRSRPRPFQGRRMWNRGSFKPSACSASRRVKYTHLGDAQSGNSEWDLDQTFPGNRAHSLPAPQRAQPERLYFKRLGGRLGRTEELSLRITVETINRFHEWCAQNRFTAVDGFTDIVSQLELKMTEWSSSNLIPAAQDPDLSSRRGRRPGKVDSGP
jgi:hypothetical protein